jgi:hypothetical protein
MLESRAIFDPNLAKEKIFSPLFYALFKRLGVPSPSNGERHPTKLPAATAFMLWLGLTHQRDRDGLNPTPAAMSVGLEARSPKSPGITDVIGQADVTEGPLFWILTRI